MEDESEEDKKESGNDKNELAICHHGKTGTF